MSAARATVARAVTAAAVLGVCATAGYLFGVLVSPVTGSRMFPWIVARATGVGAFVALGGLLCLGLVFRRPTGRRDGIHRETLLRVHVALVPALVVLVSAHVWSLLADRWSGVTAAALVIPDAATYRPGPVTLGVVAGWMILAVMVTAALAGRRPVGRRWALLHKASYPAFALVWLHGVLSGSDTPALRWLYVVVGLGVGLAAMPAARRRREAVST